MTTSTCAHTGIQYSGWKSAAIPEVTALRKPATSAIPRGHSVIERFLMRMPTEAIAAVGAVSKVKTMLLKGRLVVSRTWTTAASPAAPMARRRRVRGMRRIW